MERLRNLADTKGHHLDVRVRITTGRQTQVSIKWCEPSGEREVMAQGTSVQSAVDIALDMFGSCDGIP